MNNEIKNTGLDLEREAKEISPKDWEHELGAEEKKCLTADLDLFPFLPEGEIQRGKEDFMDCATRAPINDLETKFTALVKMQLISDSNIQWLKDTGYSDEDGNVTFSDIFPAILSNTTRNGNSLKAPWEAIRKFGLIPKKLLPANKEMTWNDYHNKGQITGELLKIGREFNKRFGINYERVKDYNFSSFDLDTAGYAWSRPVNGIYPRVDGRFNHAFYKLKKLPAIKIFDNYFV